ncbi:MAG: TatD family hydrolase [Candidatus Margulisiibacteriota bacterium]
MLVDTHAHLNLPEYFDLADVLARAQERGVKYIIDVGIDLDSIRRSLDLSARVEEIYSAVGIHPQDTGDFSADTLAALRRVLGSATAAPKFASRKIVAIGEVGLDYFKEYAPRENQRLALVAQIKLANEFGLPLIIHSRASEDETLTILRENMSPDTVGVFHCFAGNVDQARKVLDLGFYISVTGIVTFPKAQNIVEVVKIIPLDKLMLETDCPFLSPEPLRGKRNEPANVYHIAQKISAILAVPFEEVARKTSDNACRLFNLP